MEENNYPTGGSDNPPPRPEVPWQEEQQALSDIDRKINRLGGSPSPPPAARGGGGSGRWAGIPVVIVIVIGMRVAFGLMSTNRSTDHTPPPRYQTPVILQGKDWQPRIDEMVREAKQRENPKQDLRFQDDPHDVRQPPLNATQKEPRPVSRNDHVGPPEP
jgi:hypothetical protein